MCGDEGDGGGDDGGTEEEEEEEEDEEEETWNDRQQKPYWLTTRLPVVEPSAAWCLQSCPRHFGVYFEGTLMRQQE